MANNKQNKCPNVPPLRFPEFTEPWERYKVSDILDFYSTNSLSWEQLEFTDGELRNLHYGMIHVGLPTLLNLKESKLPTIKEGNEPKSYTLCINGDVAFADASEDTNDVAKAIEVVETDGQKVVFGLHTIHGRDNKGLTESGFKGYLFSSKIFHDQIKRIAQGTKVFSISNKSFSECFVGLPSKAEQSKIARLLSLLDCRIAVQSKLIEQLQSLIKGIIELLTAQSPNVRIADCLDCYSSTLQENQLNELGKCRVYGANGVCGYTASHAINGDAILIVKDGSGVGNVSFATGEYSVIGTLNYLTSKNGYNLRYIYYCLMNFNFAPYKTGMAIPHIYFKDYGKAKIYCPALEEQDRIANILSKIECKIAIERSISNHYIELKQYLLQRLFI